MLARILTTSGSLLLLAICLASIGLALRGAPAVDATARTPGVFGDWRVPDGAALYSAPDYLFQLGFGYLQADAVASAETEGPEELASEALMQERVLVSRTLLMDSLRLAPADARTWTSLAWADALLGDVNGARSALAVSWQLAPFSQTLAPQRLALAQAIGPSDPPSEAWATDADRMILQRFGSRASRALFSE